MRVGILGFGLMGGKLGTLFARGAMRVVFSYARSKEKLNRLARDARDNARAGTPKEVAQGADALLLAVHWSRIDDVLSQAGDLAGKVIVSCSLPLNVANTELVLGHTTSGAEALAKKAPGAQIISAFNNIPSEMLFGVFEARGKAAPPSMVYCGDTQAGKDIAATLIRDVGSTRSMPALSGTRDISSRSRCSLLTSRMEEPKALDLSSVGLRQLDRTGLPFRTVWAKRLTQQKPKTKVIIMNNGIAGKVAVITAASSLPKPDPHPQVANKNLVMVTS